MPDIYIPVKNREMLEKHNAFTKPAKLYQWSHYRTYPGLFKKLPKSRDLFLVLSKYNELFQEVKNV